MTKVKLDDWLNYLESRVGIDLYVWGANGETLIDLLPQLCQKEKSLNDVDRTLTLLQKRLLKHVDIYKICCEDCSGLSIKYLLEHKVVPYDMTANSLYEYIVGTKDKEAHGKEISLKDVKAGDYLFKGSATNKTHVGYAISHDYAIESQDHDKGVVQTKISDRPWGYAARPNWYEGDEPEPEKPILKRELYYEKIDGKIVIRGEDVKEAQKLLLEKGYNPGDIDGIFGKNTSIATQNFQDNNDLSKDGIIGKKTAEKLGFKWEGV